MNKKLSFTSNPKHKNLLKVMALRFIDSIYTLQTAGVILMALMVYAPTVSAHNHHQTHAGDHNHKSHAGEQVKATPSKAASKHKVLNSGSSDVQSSDVVVNVNGMVCSFCTSNIEKRFKKEKAIKNVVVNLDEKKVYLNFKPDSTLSDEQITSNIKKAGYNVVSIERF